MLYFHNMSRRSTGATGVDAKSDARFDLIFKALGDSRRRRILDLLRDEPRSTGQLCALIPALDRCTVMQHLGVLERANLIVVRRVGRVRWNHLNALPIQDIADRWINRYAVGAVQRLANLRDQLEGSASADAATSRSRGDAAARGVA